jgi:hypothetical protein
MGRPKGQTTLESWFMTNGKEGEQFYTEKADKHLTALATYYKRQIKTERLITVSTGGKEPTSKYITRVTIL